MNRLLFLASLALLSCGGSTQLAPDQTGGSGQADAAPQADAASEADASPAFVTGRPCSKAEDCGPGFACLTEAPGGYCVTGSAGGPMACTTPDHPCTEPGSTCSPMPWHQISGVCLLSCKTTADCRSGYICNYAELFPGDPSGPKSPTPVCWIACQYGMDQTCNDNSLISSIHGKCLPDGTCECSQGFAKNPTTGRCL